MNNPRPLRVFVAGLAHETNSFSPLPTSLRSFRGDLSYRPPSIHHRAEALSFAGYGDAIAVCRSRGDVVIEGPCFWTQPSGPVPTSVYAELRDEILDALTRTADVDIVILNLHGAMIAQTLDDCEGDILNRVRSAVGPGIPVGAILDLHGNVSAKMVASGAILIGCKEYPHTDYRERAEELHAILADMARNSTRPTTLLRTIPSLSLQGTTEMAMRDLVDDMGAAEGRDGIVSITLMHGFPWADTDRTGASILIVSDKADPQRIDALADDLAARFMAIADEPSLPQVSVEDAIATAFSFSPGFGPVVIADMSDNAGGGAAGDSTFLLREMLRRDCDRAAVGMIWDPQTAQIAADAGARARLRLRIGGKVGVLSGDPIDVEAEVLAVRSDIRQRFFSKVPNAPLGLAVGLRVNGIDIVVNSLRQQVFAPECFTDLGISLHDKAVVVVKSRQHFRALFDPIAQHTIYCNAPGSTNSDFAQMRYRHLHVAPKKAAFAVDRPILRMRWPDTAGPGETG